MVQKIVQSGDPILRKVSKPVLKIDKKIKNLIKDLKDTLAVQVDPEGVGLAAPQIGKGQRVFVASYKNFKKVVINPEIIELKEKTSKTKKSKYKNKNGEILEGCLSLPHYYGPLKRSDEVKIKYMDETGKQVDETFTGFNAQIILHEIDHLEGKLFVDRLLEQNKKLYKLSQSDEWEEVEI